MAVVAVGDFDTAAMEALIKTHFAADSDSRRRRSSGRVHGAGSSGHALRDHDRQGSRRSRASPSTTSCRCAIRSTVGAYRADAGRRPVQRHAVARVCSKSRRQTDAPFRRPARAAACSSARPRPRRSSANVKDGGVEAGLDAVFTETERVVQFGFTANELERQKKETMVAVRHRSWPRRTITRPRRSRPSTSATICRASRCPASRTSTCSIERFLPEITLDEVNALAKDWSPDRNRVVTVSRAGEAGPDGADAGAARRR